MAEVMGLRPDRIREFERIVRDHWKLDAFKRFQCVWLERMFNLGAEEIAEALRLHVSTVRRIQAAYAREGRAAIEGRGNRGGRRRNYLDYEEETAFLNACVKAAKHGRICTVTGLKASFEVKVGHKVNKTTIYRLLERHGWGPLAIRMHYPPEQEPGSATAAS